MTASIVAICVAVYLGMILGALPFLQLDRTGIALLGAIAIVGTGALSPEQAALSVHLPTLLLLFSFMVIAAQMRLGGFYDWVTVRLAGLPLPPAALLAAVIAVVGLLSAVFSNDVVCLAVAPALIDACAHRRLDPIVGSVANIIVVGAAHRHGIQIDWRRHARVGVPVTLITLAIAGGWLALRA
jgi:Na+/H+ antiporter NhaD/arsenite permease-like protein